MLNPKKMVILLIFLAVAQLAGCAFMATDFDQPKVDLMAISPQSGSSQPGFQLSLRIVNPNQQALVINGIYYELAIEGNALFSGVSNTTTQIPGYGEGVVTLSAVASVFGAIGLVQDLLRNSGGDLALRYSLATKLSVQGMRRAVRTEYQGELLPPTKSVPMAEERSYQL